MHTMSSVTAVLVMTGMPADDSDLLGALNVFFKGATTLKRLDEDMGGTKHPQVFIAGGGFNHLDEAGFLAFLRAFDWMEYDTGWAQVALHGEDSDGFGLVEVFRDPNGGTEAWHEPT